MPGLAGILKITMQRTADGVWSGNRGSLNLHFYIHQILQKVTLHAQNHQVTLGEKFTDQQVRSPQILEHILHIMASPDHLPVILIHGAAQTGKTSLFKGLVGNMGRGSDASTSTVHFDTKYYTASAEVQVTGGSHEGHNPDGGMEALLLVFDASR